MTKGFVFIHNPKTGGGWIRYCMHNQNQNIDLIDYNTLDCDKHISYDTLITLYPDYKDLFPIVFVRHPIDRYVSLINSFILRTKYNGNYNNYKITPDDSPMRSMNQWLDHINNHRLPDGQLKIVKSVTTHPKGVVCRFENLVCETSRLASLLGINLVVDDRTNKSWWRKTCCWKDYVCDEVEQWFRDNFKEEFEALEYE